MFYEGLRLLGGRMSNHANTPGGCAKEGPHVRGGSELGSYEDLMNVSRILALGGSTCRILCVWLNLSCFTCVEGSGKLNLSCFTCPEGSGRVNLSYSSCVWPLLFQND